MSNTIVTPNFRGSFVHLGKPHTPKGSTRDPMYSLTIVLPKKEKSTRRFIDELNILIREAVVGAWGESQADKIIKKFRFPPIGDGDNQTSETEIEQFYDSWFIRASNTRKVPAYRPRPLELFGRDEIEEECYSGAWYKAEINAYAWENPQSGKGVSISLIKVQKRYDDDQFAGVSGRPADEIFDEVDDD